MELLIFVLGVVFGCYITRVFMKPKYAGTLKSVKTELDDQPALLLDLYESGETISNSNYVIFRVEKIEL